MIRVDIVFADRLVDSSAGTAEGGGAIALGLAFAAGKAGAADALAPLVAVAGITAGIAKRGRDIWGGSGGGGGLFLGANGSHGGCFGEVAASEWLLRGQGPLHGKIIAGDKGDAW